MDMYKLRLVISSNNKNVIIERENFTDTSNTTNTWGDEQLSLVYKVWSISTGEKILINKCKVSKSRNKRKDTIYNCEIYSGKPGFCLQPCFGQFHK